MTLFKKIYKADLNRYKLINKKKYCKRFSFYLRKAQYSNHILVRNLYRFLLHRLCLKNQNEIFSSTKIGQGFCLNHPYNITISNEAIIGENVTINKNVTIGREFRGSRNGCPQIGNKVWIGANAVIVGNITIGEDVLIAANTFINENIPSHCVVFGNPCVIKEKNNATDKYI